MITLQTASQILSKIDRTKLCFPSIKITNITDCSRGVDQQVKIITYVSSHKNNKSKKQSKLIIKYPKQQPDKILHEVVGCQLSKICGVPVPEILYHDDKFLVQTFIQGQILSSVAQKLKKKDQKQIYICLGNFLNKIHNNKGKGYGKIKSKKLKGEHLNQQHILNSMHQQLQILKNTNHYSPSFIQKIRKYICQNSDLVAQSQTTSLLHGDYCQDNILSELNHVTGVVDFGDLALGNPMEDFSRLYIKHYDSPKWKYIVDGYGQIQFKLIEFYTVYFCLWRINGVLDKGKLWGVLRKLQNVVKRIINK